MVRMKGYFCSFAKFNNEYIGYEFSYNLTRTFLDVAEIF